MVAAFAAVVSTPLLAQRSQIWDPRLLWATVAFVVLTLLGALLISFLNKWRKWNDRTSISPDQQLSSFRQLYEDGELSQEEFDRIQQRLRSRIRHRLDGPEGSSATPPKTPDSPEPPATPGMSASP